MRFNNFSGMFCLMVPTFALVGLGEWSTPHAVNADLSQGVEVVAVDQSDEVVNLSDWEFTSCCCEAGARPIDGLGSWRYTGGRTSYAGGGPAERSATVRPVVNIYVIKVNGGGRRAFGSRNFANRFGNGSQVQSVSVNRAPQQNRFRNIIALRRPGLFGGGGFGGGVDGAFDISNIFTSVVGQQAQRSGGLSVVGSGFDIANVLRNLLSQSTNGGASLSSDNGGFVPVATSTTSFGYGDGGYTSYDVKTGGGGKRAKLLESLNQ